MYSFVKFCLIVMSHVILLTLYIIAFLVLIMINSEGEHKNAEHTQQMIKMTDNVNHIFAIIEIVIRWRSVCQSMPFADDIQVVEREREEKMKEKRAHTYKV